MFKLRQFSTALVLSFLAGASAWAQPALPQANVIPGQPRLLAGPLAGFGGWLMNNGINLHIVMNDALANNAGTGNRPARTSNNLSNYINADFDLAKLAGIPGGTLHTGIGLFFARARNGTNINAVQDISSVLGSVPVLNRDRSWYLTSLSYEQRLFNRKLDFELGRMNAKRAFDLPYTGNDYSGGDPIFTEAGGTSPAPYAHWGGRIAYQATPRWRFGFGTYEVFPGEIKTFGTDWRTSQATGALFVTNAVYQTSFSNTSLPGRYEVVPFYNSSPVKDPLHPQFTHSGAYGIAMRLQQTIWRSVPFPGATPGHLDFLGSLSYSPNHYINAQSNEEIGIGLYGLGPLAPADSIQVKADHLRLTGRSLEFQTQARVAAGGPDISTSPDEFRFEVNGDFAFGRAFAFQPIVEYILNPDSSELPNSPRVPRSGFVVAAMFIAKPAVLLGLSQG